MSDVSIEMERTIKDALALINDIKDSMVSEVSGAIVPERPVFTVIKGGKE